MEIEQNGLGFNNLIFMAVVLSELAKNPDAAYRSLIVEEPEAHLHPHLQRVLLSYLAGIPTKEGEKPVQLFVTSHSPNFASNSALQGTPNDGWMLALKRMLWTFTRNEKTGLPLSSLEAKTKWHPQLLKNMRELLAKMEKEFGLKTVATFGQRMAKKGLEDIALTGVEAAEKKGPGIRVETVHQVKGESIGAVLYVATKANISALLEGTGTEEGRIGYVALTRARNLFWLAVPNSCLGAMRVRLIEVGFTELPAQ